MTAHLHEFPATPTMYRRLTDRQRAANMAEESRNPYAVYDAAKRGLLSAGQDWVAMLGYAETLSRSPRWTDTELARHTRQAYSRHLRSQVEETPAQVAAPHWPAMGALALGVVLALVVIATVLP